MTPAESSQDILRRLLALRADLRALEVVGVGSLAGWDAIHRAQQLVTAASMEMARVVQMQPKDTGDGK